MKRVELVLIIIVLLLIDAPFVQASDKRCDIPEVKDPIGKPAYTFIVFGDQGAGSRLSDPNYIVGRAMTQVCAKRKCDFAIGLGDNFYPEGVRSSDDIQFISKFEAPYKDLHFPFYMSLGNHDYKQNPQAEIQYQSERWKMPCAYYPVPHLPSWLNLFALDTTQLTQVQVEQAKSSLCKKPGWRILFGHHPVFSNGGKHGDTSMMKKWVLPLVRECGIQMVLSGHDHHQEHISTPDFDQFIQGAAGKQRPVVPHVPRAGLIQRFASSSFGFAVFEMTVKTFDVDFYNAEGQVIYHFGRQLLF